MQDWRIDRRRDCCSACEQGFVDGGAYYSVLLVAPVGLERRDHCPSCFRGRTAQAGEEEIIFWRTRYLLEKRRGLALDFDLVEQLFLALAARPEEGLSELRYLLSLLLLRKKRLKLVGVRRQSSGETLCVRRPRRQEEFEVQVFELDSARAATLQAELARVFEGAGVEGLSVPHVESAAEAKDAPVAEARARD